MDVAFTSLPPEYNCRWSVAGVVSDEVKIFHGRLIDFSKNISGLETEINISNAIDKINSRIDTRVFVNQSGDLQCFVREG